MISFNAYWMSPNIEFGWWLPCYSILIDYYRCSWKENICHSVHSKYMRYTIWIVVNATLERWMQHWNSISISGMIFEIHIEPIATSSYAFKWKADEMKPFFLFLFVMRYDVWEIKASQIVCNAYCLYARGNLGTLNSTKSSVERYQSNNIENISKLIIFH